MLVDKVSEGKAVEAIINPKDISHFIFIRHLGPDALS